MKCIILAAFLVSASALAQPFPTQLQVAEQEFNKGNTAYNLGRFDEAIEHFTRAYEEWPQPEFLYNIAQAHRLAGHCKDALHFYKRFRALSGKKAAEIDKIIADLSACAAKADATAASPPIATDPPPSPPSRAPATAPAPDPEPEPEPDPEPSTDTTVEVGAPVVAARAAAGIAVLAAPGLRIPVQPAISAGAAYPLARGPITFELGAAVSYVPLPYLVMTTDHRASLVGTRATAAGLYRFAPHLVVRAELGVGVLALVGLETGNSITTTHAAGWFVLPSVRGGVALDYELTSNLVATAAPFAISYSPGAEGMAPASFREIDVMLGVAYRR